ncbi:MAG: hypothetical protein V4581_09135 [Bacteroidota bacterium]
MSDVNADYTISLQTARDYAKKWRDPNHTYDRTKLHAFLIPKENLQSLLDETPDTSVRAYIGIDEDGTPKLMIVGTKYNHQMETHDDMLPNSAAPGKIYDFTLPCPRACGYMSPLNDLTL